MLLQSSAISLGLRKVNVANTLGAISKGLLIAGLSLNAVDIAHADMGMCSKPTSVLVPPDISSGEDARSRTSEASEASAQYASYLNCLAHHLDANRDTLSPTEFEEIEKEIASTIADLRMFAEKWNALIGSYHERKNFGKEVQ